MAHFLNNPKLNRKEVVVLRMLLEGAVIHTGERYWILSEDGRMGCVALDPVTGAMESPDAEGKVRVVYVLDDTVQNFLRWCREIPDDDLIQAGFGLALRKGE